MVSPKLQRDGEWKKEMENWLSRVQKKEEEKDVEMEVGKYFTNGKTFKGDKEAAAKNMIGREKYEVKEAIESECFKKDQWPTVLDALEMAKIINLIGDTNR